MEKVVVAMSGGIDSSVSAFLLKEMGYDVIGITLRLFKDKNIKCCGGDDSIERFKKICNYIGIKYYIKDATEVFYKGVIEKFVRFYLEGKTPNPCVECNRIVKFDYLLKLSRILGAKKLATGHYARIERENGRYFLKRGVDQQKDQSYFLYPIKKEYLSYIMFPLGNLTKKQVKEIAKKNNIPVDINKESKDICFVAEGDYSLWLKKNGYVRNEEGYFRDTRGKIIGRHNGYWNYTIGQRRTTGISLGERTYVCDIIPQRNEVILGSKNDAMADKIVVSNFNWLVNEKDFVDKKLSAQIRYRHNPQPIEIESTTKDNITVRFFQKQFAPAKGQSLVVYCDDIVVGGGIMSEVLKEE
jgi:tRNA-specific 2-thiouridylase